MVRAAQEQHEARAREARSSAWSEPDAPGLGSAQQSITLVYALIGAAWIALSDGFLTLFDLDAEWLIHAQTMKGWLFIAATTALLFLLVRRTTRSIERSHAAILEKHRALSTLLSNVPGLVYRCKNDERWTMEFLSDGCEAVTGYPPAALLGDAGLSFADLTHPDDRARVRDEVVRAIAEDRSFSVIYRIRDASGRERWVTEQGTPVRNGGEVFLEGCVYDVTDVKRMEERLSRVERMERLGDMAGSIAHDFNNYLTVIRAYASLLKKSKVADVTMHEQIGHVLSASDRAGRLVEQLLVFARQRPQNPVSLDVAEALEGMKPLLARLSGHEVKLVVEVEPELPLVRVDPVQLEQVLMNLVANARDAMPKGGTVTIRASRAAVPREWADEVALPRGENLCLTVSDTGTGIADDVLGRIFEPYFSTKGEQGTGLGLSTVYGIVRQAGGGVRVQSREGEGTTFEIYLPAANARRARPDHAKIA